MTGVQERSLFSADDGQVRRRFERVLLGDPVQHRSPGQVGSTGPLVERMVVCGGVRFYCDRAADQRISGVDQGTDSTPGCRPDLLWLLDGFHSSRP